MAEFVNETTLDAELQEVITMVIKGKFTGESPKFRSYGNVFEELNLAPNGLLMRLNRIVVPRSLQDRIIKIAHEGHQGIVKTKRLLRERVWFVGLDSAIKEAIDDCMNCQLNNGGNRAQPLRMTPLPSKPWHTVSLDFFGPLPNGHELLACCDQQSKYPCVEECITTSAANSLPPLEDVISLMGIPHEFCTDNGPPFNGKEFKDFCDFFGIRHRKITPENPRANGQCEVFMRNMNKVIKNSVINRSSWRRELNAFLRSYRSTPHSSTGIAPKDLIFKWNNTSRLPNSVELSEEHIRIVKQARHRDELAKHKMKDYADQRRHAKPHNFEVGDELFYKQFMGKKIKNKFRNEFSSSRYRVRSVKGTMITAENAEGHRLTRNADHFKRCVLKSGERGTSEDEYEPEADSGARSNPITATRSTECESQVEPPPSHPIGAMVRTEAPSQESVDSASQEGPRRSNRNKTATVRFGNPVTSNTIDGRTI